MERGDRLALVIRRLERTPPCNSEDECLAALSTVMKEVEDEHSGVEFDPERWMTDGRLYAPQPDRRREVEGHPAVSVYRARRHRVFIGENGSIEIQEVEGRSALLRKAGADGRHVWDL
jgi:hypothetical protein